MGHRPPPDSDGRRCGCTQGRLSRRQRPGSPCHPRTTTGSPPAARLRGARSQPTRRPQGRSGATRRRPRRRCGIRRGSTRRPRRRETATGCPSSPASSCALDRPRLVPRVGTSRSWASSPARQSPRGASRVPGRRPGKDVEAVRRIVRASRRTPDRVAVGSRRCARRSGASRSNSRRHRQGDPWPGGTRRRLRRARPSTRRYSTSSPNLTGSTCEPGREERPG